MYLALWYGVLVCHQYDVCKNMLVVGMVVLVKAVFRELCPVSFLVVGESLSVLM